VFKETTKGTPQGGIISAALANTALDGLEKMLANNFDIPKYQGHKNRVNLIRFADDFVITGATKEILENRVKPLVSNFLTERGLELSEEKTKITHVQEGFDFLGQNIRKYSSKLLIKPAKKSIKSLLMKVKNIIKERSSAKQQNLIDILNPIILGWGNYHQHVVSKETFYQIDYKIWNMLWQWAKHKHPKKNQTWISKKYFHQVGEVQRWFSVTVKNDKRGRTFLKIVRLGEIPIRRHIKIKAEANPFDKKWENYFEERLLYKMETHIKGYKKLISLWKRQKGICPKCQQHIDLETHWNIHHLVPRCRGGKDKQSNLVLLHPNCHRSIHSHENSGMWLRSDKGRYKRLEPYDRETITYGS
jgi:RNA-directed DNA polymerase